MLRPGLTGGLSWQWVCLTPRSLQRQGHRASRNLCPCGSRSHPGKDQPEPANEQSQHSARGWFGPQSSPVDFQTSCPVKPQFPEPSAGVGLLGFVPADTAASSSLQELRSGQKLHGATVAWPKTPGGEQPSPAES